MFLCVSSFNPAARRLYERLGYQLVGTLTDYLVPGHDEYLFRKTTGSLGGISGCERFAARQPGLSGMRRTSHSTSLGRIIPPNTATR